MEREKREQRGEGSRLTNYIPTHDLIRFLEGKAEIIILRTEWLQGSTTSYSAILHWRAEVHTTTLTFHFHLHTFEVIIFFTVESSTSCLRTKWWSWGSNC